MILASVAIGGLSALLRIYLFYYLDVASGAAIILVATTIFFATLALTGSAKKLSKVLSIMSSRYVVTSGPTVEFRKERECEGG
jgi:hypothetical protein